MALRLAALGELVRVQGYSLVGALVLPAEDDAQVRMAWEDLPDDVGIVVLTPRAASALGDLTRAEELPLTVVMPS